MQDMYGEATGKGAKFLEAPVSGSKVGSKRERCKDEQDKHLF